MLPVDQSSSDQDNSAPSILDALKTLNIQCQVFKRNAEDLGKGFKVPDGSVRQQNIQTSCLKPTVKGLG